MKKDICIRSVDLAILDQAPIVETMQEKIFIDNLKNRCMLEIEEAIEPILIKYQQKLKDN